MDASETTRLRALLERATPRPWHNGGLNGDVAGTVIEDDAGDNVALLSRRSSEGPASEDHESWANGDIIVAAVNALPALLDRVEAAERERGSLRAQLDTVATAYRALLAGQPVPEYSGPALSEQGRATLDRLRPRRDTAATERAERAEARVRELEAQGLALAEDARAAYAQRREMGREAQRLREIIAGRTTPPTDAEIEAHAAAGGLWRFLGLRGFALSADCAPAEDAIIPRALGLRTGIARRWWALDADGVPCAWPTAEVSRG